MAKYTDNAFANSYVGTAQADDIDMRAGDDIAYGQGGDDVIHGGWGNDNLHGGNDDDTIFGEDDDDLLFGDAGDDVLDGGEGDDTLRGGDDNDTLRGGDGNDKLFGGDGNDVLAGGLGNNNDVRGEDGDDFLDASQGTARLDGGAGIDTVSYRNATSGVEVTLLLNGGFIGAGTGGAANGDDLIGIENLEGSAFGDTLDGDGGANFLSGLNGNDTIRAKGGNDVVDGGAGADVMNGGEGFDEVTYASSNAAVSLNLATDDNHGGFAEGDTLVAFEKFTGSQFADTLIGSGANETFDGNNGNDVIDGAAGTDTLDMGHWNDVTSVFANTFSVTLAEAGSDGSTSRLEFRPPAAGGTIELEHDTIRNIENVVGSSKNETITGNSGTNVIDGGGGSDTINGGAGADTLGGGDGNDTITGGTGADTIDGGTGSDTASYAGSAAGIVADLGAGQISGGDAQGDVLIGIENVTGSNFSDILVGDNGGNVLRGGNSSDLLIGRGGADTLDGGAGIDLVEYLTSTSGVTVNLTTGVGTGGDAQGDVLIGVEHLLGSNGDDTLTGNALTNQFNGRDGADTLDGAGGGDILFGENGDDLIIGGTGGDVINGGAGFDTASYANASSAIAIDLNTGLGTLGDALGDQLTFIERIIGSAFDDSFIVSPNAETIDGGAGFDTISFEAAFSGATVNLANSAANAGFAAGATFISIEDIIGSSFDDVFFGNDADNALVGLIGNDVMLGGNGNDTIVGGVGNDTLLGNAGDDTFVFTFGDNVDSIQDFVAGNGSGDVIELHGYGIANFSALQQNMTQVGSDVVISFDPGNQITLLNVQLGTLDQNDFLLL